MTQAIATRDPVPVDAALVERVLLHGDLRQLTPAQKVSYYRAVCESVGLNPLTQPFQYLVLNGREVLYARRDATEQLRHLHAVSIQIVAREVSEDCYVVTARATLPSGRQDENIGAVPIGGLKGEQRANAMMKAETKAKRRVTLAICGLGMLDETEVESIQAGEPSQGYTVTAPAPIGPAILPEGERENASGPNAGELGPSHPDANTYAPQPLEDWPPAPVGAVYIQKVSPGFGKVVGEIVTHQGVSLPVFKQQLKALAEAICQERCPVRLEVKASGTSGKDYLIGLTRVTPIEKPEADPLPMLSADDIQF